MQALTTRRSARSSLLVAALLTAAACDAGARAPAVERAQVQVQPMTVHYLEIVTENPDTTCALYERVHGLSFGPRDDSLGGSRIARRPDGSMVGVRAPLAAHEGPIVRTYLAVEDIEAATKAAEDNGAQLAYGPSREGAHGQFAIVIHDGVEHGLWQE